MALIAFAANSVLCRLALGTGAIDAASFTAIRLLSGAVTLLLILIVRREKSLLPRKGSWISSIMLFLYAITFSYAYITLDTGTGALILFGAVQISMILISVFSGNRLHTSEWLGMALAFAGFVYLVLPGVSTPSPLGFSLMMVSGIAWGIYTLRGRGSENPLRDTAHNFLRTIPLIAILVTLAIKQTQFSFEGIMYAAISGGLASGVGYSIWYAALRGLSATQAAVIQLLVPVIAALGGILFVSEVITSRLAVSALMILGGILLVILGRYVFIYRKAQ
ncbi:MAG: DMT family transporter [Candidatus Marinimicrobia bacterium]|nr:DMT family transporter [Candidatus Neomarinimicrobiota bacterium]MBT3632183.1 DMT family transporter [Candidatus Neomarinimicrobiota bacterium]MBT3824338.1 DMT family transporter [Candidatus Neomarinimicrobiota bacterium]MBT4130051.1 DMT family transporter [Candidatus Neomarinimicrobiota bacterium]MBT4295038.1 DMT family transporter [Candidatus Neomarinimicrobiota bacterium]